MVEKEPSSMLMSRRAEPTVSIVSWTKCSFPTRCSVQPVWDPTTLAFTGFTSSRKQIPVACLTGRFEEKIFGLVDDLGLGPVPTGSDGGHLRQQYGRATRREGRSTWLGTGRLPAPGPGQDFLTTGRQGSHPKVAGCPVAGDRWNLLWPSGEVNSTFMQPLTLILGWTTQC